MDSKDINIDYLNKVKKEIESTNRFFPDTRFVEVIERLKKNKSFTYTVQKGEIFYRGRIFRENSDNGEKDSKFKGYSKEESGVNPSTWPAEGRMNPAGIKLLYLATGKTTCIKEIRAASGEIVSIAQFECKEELKIADFQHIRVNNPDRKIIVDWLKELLSKGYGGRDYVITQYVSMLCQKMGFDGIMYRSKFATKKDVRKGNNIALFNYDKCECVSSDLYYVNSISLSLKEITP